MEKVRKLAAIMFSDVVGYTAMMESDEDATLALIQKCHKLQKSQINRYDGVFVKEIGDGLLAYFPDSEKAVKCGLEIQGLLKEEPELQIRIGLHRAEIYLENGDIFGEGVNIAARIEPLCDPGGIYITEEVKNSLTNESGIQSMFMGKARLKNVKARINVYAIQAEHLPAPSKNRFEKLANPKRKLAAVPAILLFIIILSGISALIIRYFDAEAKREEARNSLDEIEKLVEDSWRDFSQAYDLAINLRQLIPNDPRLEAIIERSSLKININTEPQGATVFIKRYNQTDAPWEEIGITPIDSLRLPITIIRFRIEKEGFETIMGAASTFDFNNPGDLRMNNLYRPNHLFRKLDQTGTIPVGMARVAGGEMPGGILEDFFIDKYEVTNQDYKKFVEAGGYSKKEFWIEPFINEGVEIEWDEAMKYFVDQTGNPGPSTWSNGTYPEGEEKYPVMGVSWYEAKAYARFVGKDLPTCDHWGLARGEKTLLIRIPQVGGYAIFAPFSNFNHNGPVEVGSLNGITPYGAYDMAGNVKEWCFNTSEAGRIMRGGDWSSNTYMFNGLMQAPAFDRSETNGFRCALYPDNYHLPAEANRLIVNTEINFARYKLMDPVSDEVFEVFKSFYDYDRKRLNTQTVYKRDDNEVYIHEKVIFDAAYNDEEVIAHIFTPKNSNGPFQTVLYGPGAAVQHQINSDSIPSYYEFKIFLDFFLEQGRAIVFPVIQGTFERRSDEISNIMGTDTQQFTNYVTQVIKDYRRTLDYLETREDIEKNKIAFYGISWGPLFGTILSSIDERVKTNIFIAAGLRPVGRPEANQVNFYTRIKIPTLMVNGRWDSLFPFNLSIEPLFNGINVSESEKKLVLFDTDHVPPTEAMVSESLQWLDKYFGPVELALGSSP